jgi:DNA-binding transcriptional ArsR family regulator
VRARKQVVSAIGRLDGPTSYPVIYNQMVVSILSEQQTDRVFHALADATRRDIVERTMRQAQSVSTLANYYDMSFAAVQKHVAVLERAELVTKQRAGREQLVRGNTATVNVAARLLDAYAAIWHERAAAIETILDEDAGINTSSKAVSTP